MDKTAETQEHGKLTIIRYYGRVYLELFLFNSNKLLTDSAGGVAVFNSKDDADKVRKWSTQAKAAAPWYQHEEIGCNYRMSNVVAGVIRGQLPYMQEHMETDAYAANL